MPDRRDRRLIPRSPARAAPDGRGRGWVRIRRGRARRFEAGANCWAGRIKGGIPETAWQVKNVSLPPGPLPDFRVRFSYRMSVAHLPDFESVYIDL